MALVREVATFSKHNLHTEGPTFLKSRYINGVTYFENNGCWFGKRADQRVG